MHIPCLLTVTRLETKNLVTGLAVCAASVVTCCPEAREHDEAKVPTRALDPKCRYKPDLLLLHVPETHLRRRWLRANDACQSLSLASILQFPRWDLTGMMGGWELEHLKLGSPRTLVFLLGLALAKSAPTSAGPGPTLLTRRESEGPWWRITGLRHWFGSEVGGVWTEHRSRTGIIRLSRNTLGPEARK